MKVTATISRPQPVIQPPATVTLTMDEDHAKILGFILKAVGGDPTGPRGLVDDIYHALQGAGYTDDAVDFYRNKKLHKQGSIYIDI